MSTSLCADCRHPRYDHTETDHVSLTGDACWQCCCTSFAKTETAEASA